MARIDETIFRNWNNGDTMTEADYEREREIVRVAINDTDDKVNKHKNEVELGHPDKSVTERKLGDLSVSRRTIQPGAVGATELDDSLLEFYGDIAVKAKLDTHDTQLAEKADQETSKYQKPNHPIYFEQFFRTWYGRGQLTSEIPYETVSGRTSPSGTFGAGQQGVTVSDASKFDIGSIVAIEYDDGFHDTYLVNNKSGNILTLLPPLRKTVTVNSKIERAWYNSAHAGDYALKAIGEKLANAKYDDVIYGETIYKLFMDEADVLNNFKKLGAATIQVNNENSIVGTNYGAALETVSNKSIAIIGSANGDGYRTLDVYVKPSAKYVANLWLRANNTLGRVNVKAKDGTLITSMDIPGNMIIEPYKIAFTTPSNVTEVYLEFVVTGTGTTGIYLDDLTISENSFSGYILPRKGNIVMLFDSWGNFITNGIETRLKALLPNANIINKGIGGNKATDMLARFDTDVAPYKPDVVICDTGVNDAYAMSSDDTTEYISNLRKIVDKCKEINAVPIFLGLPALPETDPRTSHVQWQLTTRSRKMAFEAKKNFARYAQPVNQLARRIDVPVSANALAQNGQANVCVGTLANGSVAKVKIAGGYLLSANVKFQVGFTDTLTNPLVGTANVFDLSATNFYEKTDSVIDFPEFYIKNNTGGVRFLVVRIVNLGAAAYTGSAFVSVEV